MKREEYIEKVQEGLIAMGFEQIDPNSVFGFQTESTFLGVTISENEMEKEILSDYTVFYKSEERPSPQDDISEYIVFFVPEMNSPEIREDPDLSSVAVIPNSCSWIIEHFESLEIESGMKHFIHVLFVTDEGTNNMKKAVKHNADAEFPNYGILPVLADLGNGTLTYNTESMGAKGLVGTPYMEQMNKRVEEYFNVTN